MLFYIKRAGVTVFVLRCGKPENKGCFLNDICRCSLRLKFIKNESFVTKHNRDTKNNSGKNVRITAKKMLPLQYARAAFLLY
jgi:hypothetical protein